MEYTPPPAPAPPPVAAPRERPFGVTILAILYVIQGVFIMLLPILAGLILAAILGGVLDFDALFATTICWLPFVILGVLYFLVALGLLKGAGWARIIAIIFAIIGLINIPIGTIISIIILIYLFKPEVKAWFQ